MKLRLRENSIRLRLLQTEVTQLREIGNVSERITFGTSSTDSLTYSLRVSGETKKIFVQMTDNQIEVFLPEKTAESWADTDQIGLYQTQNIGDLGELKIIIEKDFVCVDRPFDEYNKDAFPHLKMKC
ncbi:MAG: hypothetical protein ABI686_01830 [Acidobacteriota bacterium]